MSTCDAALQFCIDVVCVQAEGLLVSMTTHLELRVLGDDGVVQVGVGCFVWGEV